MASFKLQTKDITGVVTRLLDNLTGCISSQAGRNSVLFRYLIGDMRAFFLDYIKAGTFGPKLLAVFAAAETAQVDLAGLKIVHDGLFAETPQYEIAQIIVQTAVVMCLATESRLTLLMTFVSRDDVDAVIAQVKVTFDTAKVLLADLPDSGTYRSLIALGGSLVNYLNNVARPLPRMVTFNIATTYGALSLSQLIYYVGNRSDEIIGENKIVHPAFCPRVIRGLAS